MTISLTSTNVTDARMVLYMSLTPASNHNYTVTVALYEWTINTSASPNHGITTFISGEILH